MRVDLAIHIAAGGVGILSGFAALSVAKGAPPHRKIGMVFVVSMTTMALVGAFIAAARGVVPAVNVPVGLLTAYLVTTALTTVRPPAAASRRLDLLLMSVALAITLAFFSFGFVALGKPPWLQGFPAAPFFVFGTFGLMAAIGDIRLISAGGVQAIRGAPRLARHLWRMCLALLIAAFSFFLGQAKVFPKPVRILPLLIIPPLIVLAALLYWLWRVRFRQSLRGVVLGARAAAASPPLKLSPPTGR